MLSRVPAFVLKHPVQAMRAFAADPLEVWIVPAAAQIITFEIVRGKRDPARFDGAIRLLIEENEYLFPIALMIVDAVERRSPIVHVIKEKVIEDDPIAVARDARMITAARIAFQCLRILDLRGSRETARNPPAQ